ncbi:cell growth regulator with EF hand domain protein 1 [Lampris incognitus]|uniref:cell growth regulator with EF hand domain protein 1 n=1 Tax=Lampris incognitus TaxID=2546036 RepID=UPI0024B5FCC9|nr:cell growth regulator with EF hand domain protein 1 [Lampris incognitus]
MRKGSVLPELHSDRLIRCVVSLYLFIHPCLAAPGVPGAQREELADISPPAAALVNPFGSGEENRRLLKSYIQANLQDGQGGPEINTWEQEVFFLFRLYDFDRSGHMDGLEMMKLLSDYNSHNAPEGQANKTGLQVVSMVDFLLQTQDLNQDGLLAPSELLSLPLHHTQNSDSNNLPHKEQEMTMEKLPKAEEEEREGKEDIKESKKKDEETRDEETQRDEDHGQKTQQEEVGTKEEVLPNHDVNSQEFQELEEEDGLPVQETPEKQKEQVQREALVHVGQPEM